MNDKLRFILVFVEGGVIVLTWWWMSYIERGRINGVKGYGTLYDLFA